MKKVKCGIHGKKKWNGDVVCASCGAIWICEPAADPKAPKDAMQFRLQNTQNYTKGACVCGARLFGDTGKARVACADCVAKTDHGVQ